MREESSVVRRANEIIENSYRPLEDWGPVELKDWYLLNVGENWESSWDLMDKEKLQSLLEEYIPRAVKEHWFQGLFPLEEEFNKLGIHKTKDIKLEIVNKRGKLISEFSHPNMPPKEFRSVLKRWDSQSKPGFRRVAVQGTQPVMPDRVNRNKQP